MQLQCFYVPEPTDAGIIPPEYRTFAGPNNQVSSTSLSQPHSSLQSSNNSESSVSDKKAHQWSTNPVEEWAKEQVRIVKVGSNVE